MLAHVSLPIEAFTFILYTSVSLVPTQVIFMLPNQQYKYKAFNNDVALMCLYCRLVYLKLCSHIMPYL